MSQALIVFASRTGETEAIANLIAEGIRIAGHQATVVKVDMIKNEQDLQNCDALILGSATYHGEMMQSMKTLLFLAEKAALEGKAGGAFGGVFDICLCDSAVFDLRRAENNAVASP